MVEGWNRYFSPASCFTLLENMKIWCKIQVIIYPLFQDTSKPVEEKIKEEEKKIEDIKEEADKQQEAENEPEKEN